MANYGGPDKYAFQELLDAVRSQGDAVSTTIRDLGETAGRVLEEKGIREREESVDLSKEARAAGLEWEGMDSGKRFTLRDWKKRDPQAQVTLASLAATYRKNKEFEAARTAAEFLDSLQSPRGPNDISAVSSGTVIFSGSLAGDLDDALPDPMLYQPVPSHNGDGSVKSVQYAKEQEDGGGVVGPTENVKGDQEQGKVQAGGLPSPPMVRTTHKEAIRAYQGIIEKFEKALDPGGKRADVLKYYKLAEQFEKEVLKPNGITGFFTQMAHVAARTGDAHTAKTYEDMSLAGLRRKAAQAGVSMDALFDTATVEGLEANFPQLGRPLLGKLALQAGGDYPANEHPDASIISEIGSYMKQYPDDPYMVKVQADKLLHLFGFIDRTFSDKGTTAQRAHEAITLARMGDTTGADPVLTQGAYTSLVNLFEIVHTVPDHAPDNSSPDGLSEGAPAIEAQRKPTPSEALTAASTVFSAIHKAAPTYASAVFRMLDQDVIDPMAVSKGILPHEFALKLVKLAPAISSIENVALDRFPDNPTARLNLTKKLLHGVALSNNVSLYEPDADRDNEARNAVRDLKALVVDPDDFSAQVGLQSQLVEPAVVMREAVERAVAAGDLTQADADKFLESMRALDEFEDDRTAQMLARLFNDKRPDGTPFSTEAAKIGGPYSNERLKAALQLDKARQEVLKGAGVTDAPITTFDSVEDALANSLKLDYEKRDSWSYSEKDKFARATQQYNALWNSFIHSGFVDVARDLEQAWTSFKLWTAGAKAAFTDEEISAARRRVFLNSSVKIKGTELRYEDLFPEDAQVDAFVELKGIHEGAAADGLQARLLQSAVRHAADRGLKVNASKVSPSPVAARVYRIQLIKGAVDRGLKEGWLQWDPERGALKYNTQLTAEKYRKAKEASERPKGETVGEVRIDAPWISANTKMTLDLKDPLDVAVAMRAIASSDHDGDDAAANEAAWRQARDEIIVSAKLAVDYPESKTFVEKQQRTLLPYLPGAAGGHAQGNSRKKQSEATRHVARDFVRHLGELDQIEVDNLTKAFQAAEARAREAVEQQRNAYQAKRTAKLEAQQAARTARLKAYAQVISSAEDTADANFRVDLLKNSLLPLEKEEEEEEEPQGGLPW